jgi:hypothetical protein
VAADTTKYPVRPCGDLSPSDQNRLFQSLAIVTIASTPCSFIYSSTSDSSSPLFDPTLHLTKIDSRHYFNFNGGIMRHIPFLTLLLLSLALTGCGDPKINTSSDKTMQDSIKAVRASLPEDKQSEFDQAIQILMFADVQGLSDLGKLANTDAIASNFKNRLNGKTGLEVITEAQKVRDERAKQEQQQKLNRLADLGQKLKDSSKAQDILNRFVIQRSRFYFRKSSYSTDAILELSVVNNTDQPVSRVYFEGTLATPGRAVPWVQDTFNYQIDGGLEPGEKATWQLNAWGDWDRAPKDRNDMVLTVRTTRLDDANGAPIAKNDFDKDDSNTMRQIADDLPQNLSEPYLTELQKHEQEVAKQQEMEQKIQIQREGQRRAEEHKEQIRQMQLEVEQLKKQKSQAIADADSRKKFQINRSRFYYDKSGFMTEATIELAATNNTGQTITRFVLQGRLASPGRELPWVDAGISFVIDGGLETGESRTWHLTPNILSDWRKAPKNRDDMVLTVTVDELYDAQEKPIFGTQFTEEQEARLKLLESQLKNSTSGKS